MNTNREDFRFTSSASVRDDERAPARLPVIPALLASLALLNVASVVFSTICQ